MLIEGLDDLIIDKNMNCTNPISIASTISIGIVTFSPMKVASITSIVIPREGTIMEIVM